MKKTCGFIFILILSLLSLATVFKKKDPIQLTQTDPIRQEEKAKEEAEGKKGPPAPTVLLYPKERFLVEAPLNPEKEGEIPEETEEWEEFELGEFKLNGETDDTWASEKW